ncbi:DNA mismatch repair protein MutS [Moorella sulfitireducens]|uniref:DNA mismatch repair protein MutS n=1 Tax=Neomoorella sulfitireducens TaxID=2972948 RepID=UPI003BF48094
MMEQYRQIKSRYPDSILFFRLGDFYEMFYEDAEVVSRELDLVLTTRGGKEAAPMCGVPYHAADSYLARLIAKGYKVAICEQMEDPSLAKGLVRREVIRVVTPGTIIDEKALPARGNNYLAAVVEGGGSFGLAWADASTGEFQYALCQGLEELLDELVRLMPAEYLLPPELAADASFCRRLQLYTRGVITSWPAAACPDDACRELSLHFGEDNWRRVELPPGAALATAMVLSFLKATQQNSLAHLDIPAPASVTGRMVIDQATRRNLELVACSREQKREGSLLWVLDKTVTAMGARTLRRWLDQPLVQVEAIKARQEGVGELVDGFILRQELRDALQSVRDLERLAGRVAYGTAGGRDLQALRKSLAVVPEILALLAGARAGLLLDLREQLDPLTGLVDLLGRAIVDDPPLSIHEGGIIKPGYNSEVDDLRRAAEHGREWIAALEAEERERTGIKSLKVGYNRVFGYYIEVTRPNLPQVPDDYERKQTLANAERFVTRRLQELERQVLGAEERLVRLEYELFQALREEVLQVLPRIQRTARALGVLDALLSLATVAVDNNYTCPLVDTGPVIQIEQGRHPVVEMVETHGSFVPNDTYLDQEQRVHIITGPNMAGKSTYIRQVALIVLMAQIGSFVPARRARIGVVDRIFTRVGAADDLFAGQSTFMVEMQEVANILRHATRRSLVILDEVGRGTSTADGLSIARAVTEYLHDVVGARTLFATHYHELVTLAGRLAGVKNYCVAVREEGEDITFLRTIVPGSTDKSYGIHVARLAGLPPEVLRRARELLEHGPGDESRALFKPAKKVPVTGTEKQVLKELASFPLMASTPLEAMEQIFRWQRQLQEQGPEIVKIGRG